MNKISNKKQIHDSVKAIIEEKIRHFQKEMAQVQNAQSPGKGGEFDLAHKSENEADHELTNKLNKQLNHAKKELIMLERTGRQDKMMEKVEPGAVVMTDKIGFYISVATDQFTLNGKEMMGLSEKAPIYKVMHGKKKGESFSFREINYKIEEVF